MVAKNINSVLHVIHYVSPEGRFVVSDYALGNIVATGYK